MEKATVVVVGLLVGLGVKAEVHEFSTPDGKTVKAEIIGFNAKLGKVELKREGGKRVKVKPAIFVQADQAYIQEWAALDGFRNPSSFKVECRKKTVEKWKEDGSVHEVKYERKQYEVKIENRTSTPIEGLAVECRIYYEQEKSRPGQSKTTLKLDKPGKLDLTHLRTKETRTLKTDSIVLESRSFNSVDYYYEQGDPQNTEGKLKGIWLRITAKTSGGQTAVRNIYEPASIEGKFRW